VADDFAAHGGDQAKRRVEHLVVLFHSTHHALRAESLVRAAGMKADLVPVPRQLSSDCGVCLCILSEDRDRVVEILAAHYVEIAGVWNL